MRSERLSISVVIPIFNEQKSVSGTVVKINNLLKQSKIKRYEIIAVNDNSTDKSLGILLKLKGKKVLTSVINHTNNQGYGASLKDGIRISKYDHILIIDADGTYPIEEIPNLIKKANEYEMVIGARIKNNVYIPIERKLPKKVMLTLARILTGNNILDINSGMRIFTKHIALKYWHLFPDRWSMSSTLTLCSHLNDHSVVYVPISYKKRVGVSTMKAIDFFYFIGLITRLVVYFKPFIFFFWPGFVLTSTGLIWIIYTLISERNITDTGLVFFMTGLQISFFGLVADLIVRTRKLHEKEN